MFIFDAVLMLLVMLVFNILHPSEVVALQKGGLAAKKAWKMERIAGHHHRVISDDSESGLARL